MRVVSGLLAVAFLCFASPAFAQQIEGIPNFANCKDDSLDRVMKNGITLGISPSPPYSSLDPNTKKAEGLDVEIELAEKRGDGRSLLKGIRAGLDQPVAGAFAADGAAEAGRSLEKADRFSLPDEAMRGGETGDASADDRDGQGGISGWIHGEEGERTGAISRS